MFLCSTICPEVKAHSRIVSKRGGTAFPCLLSSPNACLQCAYIDGIESLVHPCTYRGG